MLCTILVGGLLIIETQCKQIEITIPPKIENAVQAPTGAKNDIVEYAKGRIIEEFGEGEWEYFDDLVMRESGWNPRAVNKSSGACGLPQSLPCNKIGGVDTPYQDQIEWMIGYVKDRYQTPSGAIKWHNRRGWY